MKRFAALALLVLVGCASDARRVANAATAHLYLEPLYEKTCVPTGPVGCQKEREALNTLKWEVQTCANALAVGKGKLPKIARQRLNAAKKAAEVMP